jgi:hypothetical protein
MPFQVSIMIAPLPESIPPGANYSDYRSGIHAIYPFTAEEGCMLIVTLGNFSNSLVLRRDTDAETLVQYINEQLEALYKFSGKAEKKGGCIIM